MYLDALKVFCDLVGAGSFSRAATLNQITQSAVSQQIRALETRMHCKLIERGRRSVSLTPEGVAFHETCRTMLNTWTEFEDRLKSLKDEVAGTLRIASIYSIGLHELPPRLKTFRERFPQVEVKVSYCRAPEVYEQVAADQADIGLVAFPTKAPGLLEEVFDEDRLVLICPPSHRLAARAHVPFSALAGEKFVAFEPDTPTRKVIDRQLRESGVTVVQIAEFDNIETVKRVVEIEGGISIVPANTVRDEVANGQLVAIPIESAKLSRPLGYLTSRSRTRPAGLKELIAALKAG